jgi:hypothetical protein
MTIITVVPLATYPANTYVIGEISISDAVVKLRASIARCTDADLTIWPLNTVSFTAIFDYFDGTTWTDNVYFFSDVGGIKLKGAFQYPTSYAEWGLPIETNRKLRGSVTITGGLLRSSVTIDVT